MNEYIMEAATQTPGLQVRRDGGFPCSVLCSFVAFEQVTLSEANEMLVMWNHKMGALKRGNQGALCHALMHEGKPLAVTTTSNLIAGVVGNCDWMKRENTIELSRLCAARGGLCRVALRLWREFVFPALGYEYAVSYQDADPHPSQCDHIHLHATEAIEMLKIALSENKDSSTSSP